MIQWLMRLFKIPCDNCGKYKKDVHFIGHHMMYYKGKQVEDVCNQCEDEIWDSI